MYKHVYLNYIISAISALNRNPLRGTEFILFHTNNVAFIQQSN